MLLGHNNKNYFCNKHSRFTGQQWKGEAASFYSRHRHLDNSLVITKSVFFFNESNFFSYKSFFRKTALVSLFLFITKIKTTSWIRSRFSTGRWLMKKLMVYLYYTYIYIYINIYIYIYIYIVYIYSIYIYSIYIYSIYIYIVYIYIYYIYIYTYIL